MLCEICKKPVQTLFLQGDFGADPLWCGHCLANLDLADLPFNDDLMDELTNWMCAFGEWHDFDTNKVIEGREALAIAHDEQGERLATKVADALGTSYTVTFSPYLKA
ncbi:MAG: hypothetical protein RR595_11965 [Lysinibacillus sp.]